MRLFGSMLATAMLAVATVAIIDVPKAAAADKGLEPRYGDGTYVKVRHHAHYRRYLACADRYSCYALYGAYGPYGGQAYSAAYSGFVPPEYR
jgi:hypothetical protein